MSWAVIMYGYDNFMVKTGLTIKHVREVVEHDQCDPWFMGPWSLMFNDEYVEDLAYVENRILIPGDTIRLFPKMK